MKRTRILNAIGLFLNLAILACFAVGLYLYKGTFKPAVDLKNYGVLASCVVALASFFMLIPNIVGLAKGRPSTPKLFFALRFISAVMSVVVLVSSLTFYYPYQAEGFKALFNFKNSELYFYFLIPAISILMFMFIEIQKKAKFGSTFVPFVCTILYFAGIMIPMLIVAKSATSYEEVINFAPHFFFCFMKQELADAWNATHTKVLDGSSMTYLICAIVFVLSSYVFALILFIFNRISYAIFAGEEYKDAKTLAKEKANKEKLTRAQRFKNYLINEVSFNDNSYSELNHIYHISHHNRKDQTWKVKSEGAGRALKIFKTQKEAINYAKQQVNMHGGSIRIHSVGGAMRKESTWDTVDTKNKEAAEKPTKKVNKPAPKKASKKKK